MVKVVDERKTQKTTKKSKQRQKRARGKKAIVKGCELNDFAVNLS